MTIASEITRIKNNIAGAYTALSAKGATMPVTQNSANLATTVASVPAGSGETVTATNSSSYDRVSGEKVWLNKSGDTYSIINYASADINSLIGTCKANIAIGASGSVETLDDGVLVPHLTRDFTLSSAISESNINDTTQYLTLPTNVAQSFIVSNLIDAPKTAATNLKLKVKFKLIANSGIPSASGINLNLACCGSENTSVSSFAGLAPDLGLHYSASYGENDFTGGYPRDTGIDGTFTIYKSNVGVLDFDTWMTLSIETKASSPYGTLKIVDANGNVYTETSTSNAPSLRYARQRVYIGFGTAYNSQDISAVFDLSECGLFSRDESVTYWQPYKEAEG